MLARPQVFLALAGLLCAANVGAQRSVLVVGVADSSGKPIEGAEVILPTERRIARTNWMGEASIADIPLGKHRVRVRRLGYAAADIDLLFERDTVGATFVLE